MRIARKTISLAHASAGERDLAHAAAGRSVEGRVCGEHCNAQCARCGARSCQCACSPYCSDVTRMLTTDPAFPIEPGIAPLVFAMKRSGLFEPCWSCEGHANPDGSLLKPPSVWFYCAGGAPLRLLSGGLAKLRVHARWRIVLTHSDNDNREPTFALEAQFEAATLGQLQADIAAIAVALPEVLREEAKMLLNRTI